MPSDMSKDKSAPDALHASAKIYTPLGLKLYDSFALGFVSSRLLHCPTRILLPFFTVHLGRTTHLDVGVATGFYLAHTAHLLPPALTLIDLNPNALQVAEKRVRGAGYAGSVTAIRHNVFETLPEPIQGTFDAISLFYLLHCLPGTFPDKASAVFRTLSRGLAPGGTVYGATILGREARHTALGRLLMWVYNRHGVWGNQDDTEEGLRDALEEWFEEVEVTIVGAVALFVGRGARKGVTGQ